MTERVRLLYACLGTLATKEKSQGKRLRQRLTADETATTAVSLRKDKRG